MIYCRIKGIGGIKTVYIRALSEEEEMQIDKDKSNKDTVRFTIDNHTVTNKNIYMYGEINVDDDDDLDIIENCGLIDFDGNLIPTTFNYEKGTVHTDQNGRILTYPTTDPILWFKYCHCVIGKPKRIIIYNKTWK